MKANFPVSKLLFLISFFSLSVNAISQKDDIVKKGQTVPTFAFKNDQNQWVQSSELQGKVVLVTFFATWCVPCREELPLVEESIWDKYKDNQNFKLLAFGRGNSVDEVNKMKADNLLDIPMMADESKKVYGKFANSVVPRNYIIDKNGTIVYTSTGFERSEFYKMVSVLDNLLKQ